MQFRFSKINMITLICSIICLLVWTGISGLHATEDDSDDNTTASFQNQAQAQHANNVATNAALNDPDVIAAIDKAEETGDPDDIARAHDLFAETVGVLTSDISDMRGDGMGWGDIAHHFGLHPSVLGLGHSRSFGKYSAHISKHNHDRSELKAATARSFKGGKLGSHGTGVSSGSKGFNKGHSKDFSTNPGKGHAFGRGHNSGQGLALGHSNSNGNAHGASNSGGHGGGHGGGNAGGHSGGNGNGGGNGGGNGNGGGHGGGHGGGNGNGGGNGGGNGNK